MSSIAEQRKNLRSSPGRHHQAGVGLVEVLVALVIASFALLGFAGLQMASLRYQKVAQFRSLASQYSADMADRVRSNVAAAKDGNYLTPTDSYLANSGLTGAPPACPTSSATAAEVATKDLCEWRVALATGIAGGWGEIGGNLTDGFAITVYFKEPNKPKATADSLDPTCRASALGTTDKDVRCFKTVFMP